MPMRREQVAAALRAVGNKADLRRRFERATSLDPQEQDLADIGVETAASFIPGVGPALAARDVERARRADDKAGMAMAAASAIPVNRLIGALKGFDPVMREIDSLSGRAKAGGETAASNGYFYKGGQFLPTTEAEPGKWKIGKKTVTTGKELIAPGEFAVQPTPFSRSIYQAALRDVTEPTPEGLVFRPGIKDHRGNEITPDTGIRLGVKGVLGKEELSLKELIDAYNKGQRWYDVDPDAPVQRTK
jgi:hypothetical protein